MITQKSKKKVTELMKEFHKVVGYKANIVKSVAFPFISNNQLKM